MEKLIISGNGKGNSEIYYCWFISLVYVVICGVLFCHVIPHQALILNRDSYFSHRATDIFCGLGVFLVTYFIVIVVLITSSIAKTKISVYEDRVEGKGIGLLMIGQVSFLLEYNQITSVDVKKSLLMLSSSTSCYKCYVKNAAEIQNAILNQRKVSRALR